MRPATSVGDVMRVPPSIGPTPRKTPFVVIYDGECRFCGGFKAWVEGRVSSDRLRFVPCRSRERALEFPEVRESECLEAVVIVRPDKSIRVGADALAELASLLPGWGWFGSMMRVEIVRRFARNAYRWFAPRRHLVSCGYGVCQFSAPWFEPRRFRRWGEMAAAALLVAGLAGHYSFVLLHLLPKNPVTIFYGDVVDGYVRPFFVQNWHLFAPTPPLTKQSIHIQLALRPKNKGEVALSEWIDITSPLVRRLWRNRLSPAVTRQRTIEGVVGDYANLLIRWKQSPESKLPLNHAARRYRFLLAAIAGNLYSEESFELLAVRARLLHESAPPISELGKVNPDEELRSLVLPWATPLGAGLPPEFGEASLETSDSGSMR